MKKTAHKIDEKERTTDVKLLEMVPFYKMLLPVGVRNGLSKAGFVYPTVIQANAIPMGLAGIDLMVQSKSGTGKTLIFAVVLLEAFRNEIQEPQSLILVPTREIAVQIHGVLNLMGSCSAGFRAVCVIGGLEVAGDRMKLKSARAIVGTPGRILHLIKNEVLNTSKIKLLVLDEADKMMSQTFRSDFDQIYHSLPSKKQIIACSATFFQELDSKLAKYMRNPLLISTDKRATSLVGIKQLVYDIPEEKTSILEMTAKTTALKQIFSNVSFKQSLIFSNCQTRAETYRSFLSKDGWPCEVISGAQDQRTRLEIFNKFRNFKTRILISTDLMSRGVDSENVNLVVNLEVPDDSATYLHRIGRAGRFGSHGIAVTFVTSDKDRKKLCKLFTTIGNGMHVLMFPKERICDLWNFTDLENEKQLLGIFEENLDVKSENDNVNNNSPEVVNTLPDLKLRKQSLYDDEAVKLDVLSRLVDKKSPENELNEKNRDLFGDFSQAVASNNGEQISDIKNDTQYMDKSVEQIINLSNTRNKLDTALNLLEDSNATGGASGNFENKARDKLENDDNNGNSLSTETNTSFSPKTDSNSIEILNQSNQIEDDVNSNRSSRLNESIATESLRLESPIETIPENRFIRSDSIGIIRNDEMISLLIKPKVKKASSDIFNDYESYKCSKSFLPREVSIETLHSNEHSKDVAEECDNNLSADTQTPEIQSQKVVLDKSKLIYSNEEIIIANIISSSDSQKISVEHLPIVIPSTSRAALNINACQYLEASTDSSSTSHYPATSPLVTASQTGHDLNISSERTAADFMNPSFTTTELNVSTKDNSSPHCSQGSESASNELTDESNSTTDTASESDEESSGFDEKTSPEASSGVVTSESVISTDSSEYLHSTSSSNSDADNEECSHDPNTSDVIDRHKQRIHPNSANNYNTAYQTAYSQWTNFYWNQITQIQDYVRFRKYAGLNAPRNA